MVTDSEFEEFAKARANELYRSAWLLCGEHGAAEDLVQDTFARVYSRWERVSSAENPAAYVQTVLFRTFVTGRRRASSTERLVEQVPERRVTQTDPDLRVSLVRALGDLDRKDRAVLVLRYLLDLDVATVAARLDISENAVRSRASRALPRVKERLGADFLITTGDFT
jgi:RNA polymerase sigma-70 factor (sigma-E family)